MNDELLMLRETLDDALAAAHPPSTWEPPEDGALAEATWATAVQLGWDQAGLPEALGGFGDSVAPLVQLAYAIGRHRMPIPLVEAALGRWAIAAAGLPAPADGAVVTVAIGTLERVPWGRHADVVVLAREDGAIAVGAPRRSAEHTNLAGEARDTIMLDGGEGEVRGGLAAQLRDRAVLLRAAQMLGAAEQALAATREHTAARRQFGRPLDRFQLVGAHIAEMAAQAALIDAMLADATRAHDAGDAAQRATATAALKLAAGHAATVIARSAHQCHGAIGVTREYRLHQFTRRLWAWREELGAERRHARALGTTALAATPAALWAATEPEAHAA